MKSGLQLMLSWLNVVAALIWNQFVDQESLMMWLRKLMILIGTLHFTPFLLNSKILRKISNTKIHSN